MRIDCDIEASGLINYLLKDPYPTDVWCIVAKDIDTKEVYAFIDNAVYDREVEGSEYVETFGAVLAPLREFKAWSEQVAEWWGHNFLSYDRRVLNARLGTSIKASQVHDTLIMSKMLTVNRKGGHSLKALGAMLSCPKGEWDDWSQFSWGQLKYCVQDVTTSGVIREWLVEELKAFSKKSIRLEHDVRNLLDFQQQNGFYLDERKAQDVYLACKEETDAIEQEFEGLFPSRAIFDKEFTPRATKAGGIALNSTGGEPREHCTVGASFTRIKWKPFSITSPMEKIIRLEKWWSPTVRTKTGKSWQLCEENLDTLKEGAPEGLKKLARWSILNSRHKTIHTEGKTGGWFANLGWDSRVHGYVDGLGAYTGRCAHQKPNLANVPAVYDRQGRIAPYGKEMRECFTVENTSTHCIVGTDASGIQLRVLAHYINNPDYIKTIVEGRKEDKTDIHNVNMRALGSICANRGIAKTFIYAWLLGGKAPRMMSILSCSKTAALQAMDDFVKHTPGLDGLLYRKTAAAKRGWMKGLDGRIVPIPSNHHSLAVYLQNGEAVIMKLAMVLWNKWATERGIDYKQCAFVHDEWQSECEVGRADELGELQVKSIVRAGELLGLNLPLDGEYMIATDWSGAH